MQNKYNQNVFLPVIKILVAIFIKRFLLKLLKLLSYRSVFSEYGVSSCEDHAKDFVVQRKLRYMA